MVGTILWIVVVALVVVWALALTNLVAMSTTLIWIVLVVAILLSLAAFLMNGYLMS